MKHSPEEGCGFLVRSECSILKAHLFRGTEGGFMVGVGVASDLGQKDK